MPRRLARWLLPNLLLLAACGGTTAQTGHSATSGQAPAVLGTTSGQGGEPLPGPNLPTAGGINGGLRPGSATSLAGGAEASGGTSTVRSGALASGPPLRVAFVIPNYAGVNAGTGTSFVSNPQQAEQVNQREMQALVAWANAHGGVAGRRIVATGYPVDQTSTPDSKESVCIQMTEDDHQQVVIDNSVFVAENLPCFAQHRVNYVGLPSSFFDEAQLRKYSPYLLTTYATVDREMRVLPQMLKQAGYFKGSKVGVLLDDEPNLHTDYAHFLLPALHAAGVSPSDVRYVSYIDTSQQATQASSAAVRFNTEGINRVLVFALVTTYAAFASEAQSQAYHPTYAFSDYNADLSIAQDFGNQQQDNGAFGVSTTGTCVVRDRTQDDCSTATHEHPVGLTQGAKDCYDLLSQTMHQDMYNSSQSGDLFGTGLSYCDNFLLWLHAAQAVGAGVTSSNLSAGLGQLGTTYASCFAHDTDFRNGRSTGAASIRLARYTATGSGSGYWTAASPWSLLP
jgi:hypothetical protein